MVLGIGTGRIAIPIAQTGVQVIGIDSSREMLAACRRRAETEGVTELLDLRLGDLRAPPIDEPVPLIVCPFRSYLHLADDGEQVEALTAARAALAPDGRLVFNVFAPSRTTSRRPTVAGSSASPASTTRRMGRERPHAHPLVRGPSGAATMALSWISREEWQRLLEETGFTCRGLLQLSTAPIPRRRGHRLRL